MTHPILRDLSRSFLRPKLKQALDDYFDRLSWTGEEFPPSDMADEIAAVVLTLAAAAMQSKSKSTLDEFLVQARNAYSRTQD